MLHKFNPARRAGGEQRQILSFFDAFDKFMRFFEDGQGGAKVGVEHGVKTKTPKRGDGFSGARRSGFEIKTFADGCANGRRPRDRPRW